MVASSTSASDAAPVTIPEGFTLHTENSARILLPATDEAFLNPVQEFNRDMSVACIRVWSEELNAVKEAKWREKMEKASGERKGAKKVKTAVNAGEVEPPAPQVEDVVMSESSKDPVAPEEQAGGPKGKPDVPKQSTKYVPQRVSILEALSATGLRSIRYAKEIPLVKYVIANDLSPAAVEAITRNVELNDLHERDAPAATTSAPVTTEAKTIKPEEDTGAEQTGLKGKSTKKILAKVKINEGDACSLMYSHRTDKQRVDCVDLDPYGTAAPFIDAAVQCVHDGGLLCITCTDLAVLATNNYPEKWHAPFSNYGGTSLKAEYCHESALRLVLHAVSSSASRYGRYIQPLLSLSIDFYVRLFIRIQSAPIEVKKAASKTSMFYVCAGCQSPYEQSLGKITEKISEKSGQAHVLYRQQSGPPVDGKCPECNSVLHVAGPMWSGPLHDVDFVSKVLTHVQTNEDKYGTSARMKGMLTVAKEELNVPFYFTPNRIAGFFHCQSLSLEDTANALLHAGFQVSRSHALPGSLKTTASRQDIHDIYRNWIKTHPVKAENISPTSPAHFLHSKEPRFEANFEHHPQSVTQSSKIKLVRYQQNPTPNWGPGRKATGKRKRNGDEET